MPNVYNVLIMFENNETHETSSGAFRKLAKDLHEEQRQKEALEAEALALEAPSIAGAAVPEGFDLDTGRGLLIGRHVLKISPGIDDESVLGFKQIKPFLHPADSPVMPLIMRRQSHFTKTNFARSANTFVEGDVARRQGLEATGKLSLVAQTDRRFPIVRLTIDSKTEAHRTLITESQQLYAEHGLTTKGSNAPVAILCALTTPAEFTSLLAERINNTPVAVTLGAVSLGYAFMPPRVTA